MMVGCCPLCDRPATHFQIGATATFRISCPECCGGYDLYPPLLEELRDLPNWEWDRKRIARGLQLGVVKHRVFFAARDIIAALGDIAQAPERVM